MADLDRSGVCILHNSTRYSVLQLYRVAGVHLSPEGSNANLVDLH